jgi:metallo-beta-lactamase family protein
MFKILHHGAVDGVTGSCHQLRLSSGDSALIDSGLFQGDEGGNSDDELALKKIGFSLQGVKALLCY